MIRFSPLILSSLVFRILSLVIACNAYQYAQGQVNQSGDTLLGYGLVLPTPEQLKKVPMVASAGDQYFTKSKSHSIKDLMPPVGFQGSQGSCVAWALGYALASYKIRAVKQWSYEEGGVPVDDRLYSPAFIFNQAKLMANDGNCKTGITYDLAFNLIKDKGISTLKYSPYVLGDCLKPPSPEAMQNAKQIKYLFSELLNPATDTAKIKQSIYSKNPVLLGVQIDGFFQDDGKDAYNNKSYFQYIQKGKFIDYHAMVCVGYDDDKKVFTLMNSYGKKWGNNGYVDIPYYMFSTVVLEAYIVSLAMPAGSAYREPARANLNTELTTKSADTLLQSWFKPGYYRSFDDLQIGLLSLSLLTDTIATVRFTERDSGNIINVINAQINVPYSFVSGGKQITFTFDRVGRAGRTRRPAVFFTLQQSTRLNEKIQALLNNLMDVQKSNFDH